MTVKSIEERILEEADYKLQRDIGSDADHLVKWFMPPNGATVGLRMGDSSIIQVPWQTCLDALKEKAFELTRDHAREDAIKTFLLQVQIHQPSFSE